MDDDEVFRVNALSRFSKKSRLVLEAHSHCEVPAGCGGVVLQWSSPDDGAPIAVRVLSPFSLSELYLDGARVTGSRVRRPAGPRTVAMMLSEGREKVAAPWVMVQLTRHVEPGANERIAAACSGTAEWRFSAEAPPSDWASAGFNDAAWRPLGATRVELSTLNAWQRPGFQELLDEGTRPLAFAVAPRVWLRARFLLPEVRR